MDWPAGDQAGQIQRVLTTTFASTTSDYQSNADNAGNGDVRLVPMLQIVMPYESGHYANLPVLESAPISRSLAAGVDSWLDVTELDGYSILVDENDVSGDLVAYVPLNTFANGDGDVSVGFTANMFYWPSQGSSGVVDWGQGHEYRLVWFVQMLTDACPNGAETCADSAREDTLTVIHTYYDEFILAGLNVSEEHGLDVAVIYEDPDGDVNPELDDDLWSASWNLSNTFVEGRDCDSLSGATCIGDGNRDVTVANMADTINNWVNVTSTLTVTRPTASSLYPHQDYLSIVALDVAKNILTTTFQSYSTSTFPTLLFAYEDESRYRERRIIRNIPASDP